MTTPIGIFNILIALSISFMACSAENTTGSSSYNPLDKAQQATDPGGQIQSGTGGTSESEGASGFYYTPNNIELPGGPVTPLGGVGSDTCAATDINVSRTIVNIILVVDRSSTMAFPFGSYSSRWEALRAALLADPDGLIPQYQSVVRFGYEGYTGFGTAGAPEDCPNLISVPHKLKNYDEILKAYNSYTPSLSPPFAQTPTGESLELVINNIEEIFKNVGPDMKVEQFFILLATDGAPDTCINPDVDGDPPATQKVVEQIQRAFNLGVNSFVLSVGEETSDAHLQDVANAGMGTTGAPFWKANSDQGLKDALATIIGSISSCELVLEGEIVAPDAACEEGEVILNGDYLPCSDENGWRLINSTTIEIVGPACDKLKSSPSAILSARFPCNVVVG